MCPALCLLLGFCVPISASDTDLGHLTCGICALGSFYELNFISQILWNKTNNIEYTEQMYLALVRSQQGYYMDHQSFSKKKGYQELGSHSWLNSTKEYGFLHF